MRGNRKGVRERGGLFGLALLTVLVMVGCGGRADGDAAGEALGVEDLEQGGGAGRGLDVVHEVGALADADEAAGGESEAAGGERGSVGGDRGRAYPTRLWAGPPSRARGGGPSPGGSGDAIGSPNPP